MGSARDFFSSSVADALLPAFRRPFEDVIYETLDQRQVPTRTDFKELRDQINSLRGQLTGATGGVKKLADEVEALTDRLAALEARLSGAEAPSAETLAEAISQQMSAAIDAGLNRLADTLTDRVADRLGARLGHLEARLSEGWLDARLIRLREDILADVNPRLGARAETATVDLRLARLREELGSALATQVEALKSELDEVGASQPAAEVASEAPHPESGEDTHCKVPDCPEPRRSKGFCARHYQQWRRGRLPDFPYEEAS